MIPLLGTYLLTSTFLLHSIIREIFMESEYFWELVCINAFWLSFYLRLNCFMLKMGADTTEELEKTSILVLKIISYTHNAIMHKTLNNFLQQINQRQKTIKNIFFNIDWSLLFQVFI